MPSYSTKLESLWAVHYILEKRILEVQVTVEEQALNEAAIWHSKQDKLKKETAIWLKGPVFQQSCVMAHSQNLRWQWLTYWEQHGEHILKKQGLYEKKWQFTAVFEASRSRKSRPSSQSRRNDVLRWKSKHPAPKFDLNLYLTRRLFSLEWVE